ncbi:hypothetical protein, partial [Moorena sp. SIO4G3]|uniref:hypothetical protein n=1 Tax=Moorena sp. SIO4G3 TaxID=2607821 RepID=UPI0025FB83B3
PTIIRVWQEEVSQSDWTRPALDDLSLYKGEFFGGYITYTNQLLMGIINLGYEELVVTVSEVDIEE